MAPSSSGGDCRGRRLCHLSSLSSARFPRGGSPSRPSSPLTPASLHPVTKTSISPKLVPSTPLFETTKFIIANSRRQADRPRSGRRRCPRRAQAPDWPQARLDGEFWLRPGTDAGAKGDSERHRSGRRRMLSIAVFPRRARSLSFFRPPSETISALSLDPLSQLLLTPPLLSFSLSLFLFPLPTNKIRSRSSAPRATGSTTPARSSPSTSRGPCCTRSSCASRSPTTPACRRTTTRSTRSRRFEGRDSCPPSLACASFRCGLFLT